MTARALEPDYLKALYASDPDPWRFASSPCEDAKYTATLAALSQPRYASAVEIGCSIELLTARLAANCDAPLGIDVDEMPLQLARQRCAGLSNVEFAMQRLPDDAPAGQFELIMLSEVLYYFDPPARRCGARHGAARRDTDAGASAGAAARLSAHRRQCRRRVRGRLA